MAQKYSLIVVQAIYPLKKGYNIIGSSRLNDQHNQIFLENESIFPQHAVLNWEEANTFQIMDLCTNMGTAVNNVPIATLNWNCVTVDSQLTFGTIHATIGVFEQEPQTNDSGLDQNNTTLDTSESDVISCSQEMTISPRRFNFRVQNNTNTSVSEASPKASISNSVKTTSSDEDDDLFVAATQNQNQHCTYKTSLPVQVPADDSSTVSSSLEEANEYDDFVPETQELPMQESDEVIDSDDETISFDIIDEDQLSVPESQCLLKMQLPPQSRHYDDVFLSAQSRVSPSLASSPDITPKKADDSISFHEEDDEKNTSNILTDDEEEKEAVSDMSEIRWNETAQSASKITVVNQQIEDDDDETDAEDEINELANKSKTLITQKSTAEKVPRNLQVDLETQESDTQIVDTMDLVPVFLGPGRDTLSDTQYEKAFVEPIVVVDKLSETQIDRELNESVPLDTPNIYNQPTQKFVMPIMRDSQIETIIGVKKGTLLKCRSVGESLGIYNQPTQAFVIPKVPNKAVSPKETEDIYNLPTQKFQISPNKPSTSQAIAPIIGISRLREVNGIVESTNRTSPSVTLNENQVGNMTTTFLPPVNSTRLPSTIDEYSDDDADLAPENNWPSNKENAANFSEEKTPDGGENLFPKPTFSGPHRTYGGRPKNIQEFIRTPSPEPRESFKSPPILDSASENEDEEFCMAATLPIREQKPVEVAKPEKKGGRKKKGKSAKPKPVPLEKVSSGASLSARPPTSRMANLQVEMIVIADTPQHLDMPIINKSELMQSSTRIKSNLTEPNPQGYYFEISSDEDERDAKEKIKKQKQDGDGLQFMKFEKNEEESKPKETGRIKSRRQQGGSEDVKKLPTNGVAMKRSRGAEVDDELSAISSRGRRRRMEPPECVKEEKAVKQKPVKTRKTRGEKVTVEPEVEQLKDKKMEDNATTSLGRRGRTASPVEKKTKFQYKTKVQTKNVQEKEKEATTLKPMSRIEELSNEKLQKNVSIDYIQVSERPSRKRNQAEASTAVSVEKKARSTSSLSAKSASPERKSSRLNAPKVMFTMIDPTPYKKLIVQLGGQIVDIPELATILVTDQVYRSCKFLCALAKGISIVSDDWIKATAKEKGFVDPEKYIMSDQEKEQKFKFDIRKTLSKAKDRQLMAGFSVFITPSTKPPPEELSQIISCSGGQSYNKPTSNVENDEKLFVVANETDKKEIEKYKATYPGVKIMSTEGLMMSILHQELKFKYYQIK